MFKNKLSGVTIAETLLVISISSILFVIVVGVYQSRRRIIYDDAANLALVDISKVRTDAQQGNGPSDSERAGLSGKELFGQAIIFTNGSADLQVKKLAKTVGSSTLTTFGDYTIPAKAGLVWSTEAPSIANLDCNNRDLFLPCYFSTSSGSLKDFSSSGNTIISEIKNTAATPNKLVLVFKSGSGESYALTTDTYLDTNKYTLEQQKQIRIGLALSGASGYNNTESPKYYYYFDLSIPNNQKLEVIR